MYSLVAVVLIASLEPLALVGLTLPGTVLTAELGVLIDSGELSFWYAWLAGIIGCLMSDWTSLWLGWHFKKPLHRWSFLRKNKALLDKTEHALYQHSTFTTLTGRFVGPARPPVLMVTGMLDLSMTKFITPDIIGCLLWLQFYSLPGILVGAAIDVPARMQSGEFKWLLLATAVFLWVEGWLCWWLRHSGKATNRLSRYLSRGRLLWLTPLIPAIGVMALVVLVRHPLVPVYIDILREMAGVQGITLCGLPDTTPAASYQACKTHCPQVRQGAHAASGSAY